MSCCGNTPLAPRTTVTSSFCAPPTDLCEEIACSTWTDDRLAGIPPASSLNIIGRVGRGYYQLSARKGFVMGNGTKHFVSPRPEFGLPLLRKFIPAGDGSTNLQATAEGVPLEDFPSPFHSLHMQTETGQWNAVRGPTEQAAIMTWDGFQWIIEAPHDGRLKGPIPILDEVILIGTEGQSGCDEFEQVNRLNPQSGFVVGNGTKHGTLVCTGERGAQLTGLKVYSIAACTSRGPLMIPLPASGFFGMCGGNLVGLEAPVYTAIDQTTGKIPSGKNVGDFIEGATMQTDGNGCLGWKLPTAVSPNPQAAKYVFQYTGTQQFVTVPTGYTRYSAKVWGGVGSYDSTGRGGVGGFTIGVFTCTAGDKYSIIVGQGAVFDGGPPLAIYGFGGLGSPDSHQEAGGGLSGVFTGDGNVLVSDDTRAVAIAGGGGSGGATNPGQNPSAGGNGNAGGSGGMGDFHGANATSGQFNGSGAGGGGYRGGGPNGRAGRGGSGYLVGTKISGSINASGDGTAPGSSDVDYGFSAAAPGGHGLVVIEFLA